MSVEEAVNFKNSCHSCKKDLSEDASDPLALPLQVTVVESDGITPRTMFFCASCKFDLIKENPNG